MEVVFEGLIGGWQSEQKRWPSPHKQGRTEQGDREGPPAEGGLSVRSRQDAGHPSGRLRLTGLRPIELRGDRCS
jgi:hypothetical protein